MAVDGVSSPTCTPSRGLVFGPSPIIRLIHPDRTDDPGSASSTSSMAQKWERLGTGNPVACIAASSPDCQYLARGCIDGCSPNIVSEQIRADAGTAVVGRTL